MLHAFTDKERIMDQGGAIRTRQQRMKRAQAGGRDDVELDRGENRGWVRSGKV
jgi:hypothetical protein